MILFIITIQSTFYNSDFCRFIFTLEACFFLVPSESCFTQTVCFYCTKMLETVASDSTSTHWMACMFGVRDRNAMKCWLLTATWKQWKQHEKMLYYCHKQSLADVSRASLKAGWPTTWKTQEVEEFEHGRGKFGENVFLPVVWYSR